MTAEKRRERKLREHIKKIGGLCLKFPATYFTGIPDRICLLPGGRVFFAEIKGDGEKLSPRQKVVAEHLGRLGFDVWEVRSDTVLNALIRCYAN